MRYDFQRVFYGIVAAMFFTAALVLAVVAGFIDSDASNSNRLSIETQTEKVVLGETLKGSVNNPDGVITVTLRRLTPKEIEQPQLVDQELDNPRTTRCDYDQYTSTYKCDTEELKKTGVYLVQATDSKQSRKGTVSVPVQVEKND